jgi:hypothetical protein
LNKKCTKCRGSGPFYRDRKQKDGLSIWCAGCLKSNSQRYAREHPEKKAEWVKHNKSKVKATKKRFRETHQKEILEYQRTYMKTYLPKYRKKNRAKLLKKDRLYKKNNREKILKQRKARRSKDPFRHRKDKKYDLKKRFWTLEQFEEALRLQKGRCWVCGVKLILGKRCAETACADHDHKKRKRRGILCSRCNKLEGFLQKLPIPMRLWLQHLLRYLKTFE